jgi:hypothetical protein
LRLTVPHIRQYNNGSVVVVWPERPSGGLFDVEIDLKAEDGRFGRLAEPETKAADTMNF